MATKLHVEVLERFEKDGITFVRALVGPTRYVVKASAWPRIKRAALAAKAGKMPAPRGMPDFSQEARMAYMERRADALFAKQRRNACKCSGKCGNDHTVNPLDATAPIPMPWAKL